MAFPLSQGDNPEINTIPADEWTLIAQNVKCCLLKNLSGSDVDVYCTYLSSASDPPASFDIFKERFLDVGIELLDGITARDVYAFPVGLSATISAEV